jgi:hypothetical protein
MPAMHCIKRFQRFKEADIDGRKAAECPEMFCDLWLFLDEAFAFWTCEMCDTHGFTAFVSLWKVVYKNLLYASTYLHAS